MPRRFLPNWLILSLAFGALGCGASSGFLRDSMTQTQVRGSGFRILKTGLAASADTGAVFCTIPTDSGELYRRVMEQLNAQAKLLPNQMLVNIREDSRLTAYFFFYCKQRLTLSADIIEFFPQPQAAPAFHAPVAPPVEAPPPPLQAPGLVPPPPASAPVLGRTPVR